MSRECAKDTRFWKEVVRKAIGGALSTLFLLPFASDSIKDLTRDGTKALLADEHQVHLSIFSWPPRGAGEADKASRLSHLTCSRKAQTEGIEASAALALVERLNTSIVLEPRDVELRLERAFFNHQLRRYGLALADIELVLEFEPQNREALCQLRGLALEEEALMASKTLAGYASVMIGDFALSELNTDSQVALGDIYLALGSDISAIKAYTQALQASAKRQAYWGRSIAFDRLGLSQAAAEDLTKALNN